LNIKKGISLEENIDDNAIPEVVTKLLQITKARLGVSEVGLNDIGKDTQIQPLTTFYDNANRLRNRNFKIHNDFIKE